MKKTIFQCDKCKKEVDLLWEVKVKTDSNDPRIFSKSLKTEICDKCKISLEQFLPLVSIKGSPPYTTLGTFGETTYANNWVNGTLSTDMATTRETPVPPIIAPF